MRQLLFVLGLILIIPEILFLIDNRTSISAGKTIVTNSVNPDKKEKRLIPGSCTIFCVSYDGSVFFGNNEDYKNPFTYYWVKPAREGEYGVLYFGFDDFGPQGGINEMGLAFDGNALPYIRINPHPERLKASEAIVNNIIMQKCATVDEAIKMAASYDWGHLYSGKFAGQYLLADRTGDAVVIGFGSDGELAFTRKPGGNGYIVSTNFNRAYPENRYGTYPCQRYNRASNMLERVVNKREDLTVAYLSSVLDTVHEEGRTINTLYSNIFDLKNGIVYLYYWHNFTYACKLNVAEIIKSAGSPQRIKDLFPREITDKAAEEYQSYKNNPQKVSLIIAWIILVIGSGVLMINKFFRKNLLSDKEKVIWILITLLIGPFSLLFLILTKRQIS